MLSKFGFKMYSDNEVKLTCVRMWTGCNWHGITVAGSYERSKFGFHKREAFVDVKEIDLDCLTLEDGTNSLSRNFSNKVPNDAA